MFDSGTTVSSLGVRQVAVATLRNVFLRDRLQPERGRRELRRRRRVRQLRVVQPHLYQHEVARSSPFFEELLILSKMFHSRGGFACTCLPGYELSPFDNTTCEVNSKSRPAVLFFAAKTMVIVILALSFLKVNRPFKPCSPTL